jgi:Ni2+-binding GTPase involved in maturation of urease and hydrogenase
LLERIILFSGASAVGKTAVIKHLLMAEQNDIRPCVCKIDCLQTNDKAAYDALHVPCVVGLSGDICPDHFLVSNLPELWAWGSAKQCDTLMIETAGLCHRCSPATKRMIAGCVLDCTESCQAPAQLGPMLTQADFVVLTKIDMVSQAELEIITWQIGAINKEAAVFPVDGLAGYGIDLLSYWLMNQKICSAYDEDTLRYPMPSGICSYCVGEQRVGSAFQQGIVGKIVFEEAGDCGAGDQYPGRM